MNQKMSTGQVQPSGTTSQTPGVTGNELRTRSGRVVKKPERFTPQEVCEDDYASDEYNSHESESVSSEMSYDSEDISSESDADNNGNLKDFVVESDSDGSDVRSESPETDVSTSPPRGRGRGRGAPTSAKRTLVL
jgi:hypothetical protein